jgi:hypothetical protein
MNHYLDSIRAVTGLNEARDGSTPNPDALVGVQKLAALNSNTATRHILDAGLFIYRTLAEAISIRISDILEYSDFKEEFTNQIGKYNVSILNEIKDLYIYDFGIFIEISPDEEQKAKLEQNIQIALSKGDINLEDAIDIREIRNIKLANQLLKLKRTKKQEREDKMAMQKQAMQAEIQLQSQQAAAETAIAKINAETQAKIELKKQETMLQIEILKQESILKSQLMEKEFGYNMQLHGIQESLLGQREKVKEDAKAKRISQQNTEQSRLIEQRKNNLPPISFDKQEDQYGEIGSMEEEQIQNLPTSFESNEDSLDGFDMAEFEPR